MEPFQGGSLFGGFIILLIFVIVPLFKWIKHTSEKKKLNDQGDYEIRGMKYNKDGRPLGPFL